MPDKPVEFDAEALKEAEAAREWYAQRSLPAGRGFIDELERVVGLVAEQPGVAAPWGHGERLRRFPMKRFPYIVVFAVDEVVRVVAVAHTRRRPGYWQHRVDDTS